MLKLDGGFQGLKAFPPEDRPPVLLPFFSFRIMVGLWGIMVLVTFFGAYLWWRGRLQTARTQRPIGRCGRPVRSEEHAGSWSP